jgi:hypothetical protein
MQYHSFKFEFNSKKDCKSKTIAIKKIIIDNRIKVNGSHYASQVPTIVLKSMVPRRIRSVFCVKSLTNNGGQTFISDSITSVSMKIKFT